jgi:hypothetical protein
MGIDCCELGLSGRRAAIHPIPQQIGELLLLKALYPRYCQQSSFFPRFLVSENTELSGRRCTPGLVLFQAEDERFVVPASDGILCASPCLPEGITLMDDHFEVARGIIRMLCRRVRAQEYEG